MSIIPYVPPAALTGLPSAIWSGAGGLPVFPCLPGQSIAVAKAPKWSTQVVRTASGRERRTAYWPTPLWQFELAFDVVRSRPTRPELQALWEFFNIVQGQFGPWLFVDPTDCRLGPAPILDPGWAGDAQGAILDSSGREILSTGYWPFATADGATTSFPLTRPINSFVEPVFAVFQPSILDNGAAAGAYTINGGVVTFAAPPVAGHTLAWSGYFYFGCRFLQDDLTFDQIVGQLWSGKSLKFTSLRP